VEEGERAVEWIRQFTKDTPLQLEQVAQSFVLLKNFGLDPMDGTLQAIVDQNSKLGGGMERLQRISLALGQAWGKQKLQGEELRQLIEAGVPVWDLLSKATGKNVNELRKLSEQGKLGTDVIKGLIDEIGKSSEGAAADNMSLLSGLVSNMADRWTEFKNAVAESGWLDYIKAQMGDLGNRIDEMVSNGQLQALAKSISDGFISMAESIKASLHDVSFESFVASIKKGFTSISTVLGSLRSAFVITGSSITLFMNGFSVAVKSMALVVTASLTKAARTAELFFKAIGAEELEKKAASVKEIMRGMTQGFADGIEQDQQTINDAMGRLGHELVRQNSQNQQKVRTENKKTTDEAKKDQISLNTAITETGKTAQKAFADAADALKQIKAAETRTELADLGVVLARSFREGKLTQEQFNEALEANRKKLEELKEEADSAADASRQLGDAALEAGDKQQAGAEAAASITGDMASYYNSLTSELHGMSSAAEDAFLSLQGVNSADTSQAAGDIADLKHQLHETSEEAIRLSQAINYDPTGLSDWFSETGANAAYVKKQFLEQKIALEELLQGYEDGSISTEAFASQGRQAAKEMNLLNQQDLDQLNRAIEQAESGMDRLADSTQNTLESLQNELDRLQGKNDAIEQRQYQSRQRDLKSQLNEARATGDSEAVANLQKALSLNKQIYQEKSKQLAEQEREAQKRQQDEQLRKQQKRPQEKQRITSRTSANQSRTPEKVIRLEYPGGSVNVGVARNDEGKLLEALKNAGMRSL
ncbi:MAG: tape measure protein, partial [Endozoicomonas sp.]